MENNNENIYISKIVLIAVGLAVIFCLMTSCSDTSSTSTKYTSNTTGYSSNSTSSKSYSSSSSKCQYKYYDGTKCGLKTTSYDNFCNYHFNELTDTYNDLKNRWESLEY